MPRSLGRRHGSRHPRAAIVAAIMIASIAAVITGCGGKNEIVVPKNGPDVSVKNKRGSDPCKLLKAGDVSTEFGTPFAAGVPTPGVEGQCDFRTDSTDPTAPVVSLHVKGEVTVAGFETGRLTALPDARDVTGVGDQAYYRAQEGRLYVREGVFGFDVAVTPHPEPGGLERLIPLARLVVKRHK